MFHTWFTIFFWALDTSLIDFFIIYRSLESITEIAHKQFWLEVAWDLIIEGLAQDTEEVVAVRDRKKSSLKLLKQ